MSNVAYDYIEDFIREMIPQNEDNLIKLEEYAKENSVPIVHKEVGNFLATMVSIKKPSNILELGTAIGYSSILMKSFAPKHCKITTVERDEKMVNLAKSNISEANYEDSINVISGDCLDVLQNLNEKYDIIFLDAGKGHYNHFLPYCLNLLSEDGIIIADNVLFRGMVASRELLLRRKITIVKRMKEYLKMINNIQGYITTIIPMGDGIALTTRRINND